MTKCIDLSGRQFGWLSVRERAPYNQCGHAVWKCDCRCGKIVFAASGNLRKGDCTSCGCKRAARARQQLIKHGEAHSPEYGVWAGMLTRCQNKNSHSYARYGGRGICVCRRWSKSFAAFLEDMGKRPTPAHSLDRYPNRNGNYEPGNVRWATPQQQVDNKNGRLFVFVNGTKMTLVSFARQSGLNYRTLQGQYHKGTLIGAQKEV